MSDECPNPTENRECLWLYNCNCHAVHCDVMFKHAFIAGYTHGVTMARFEYVPSAEDAYKMAVASELGLA